jgi:hypothetical protein
MSNMGIEAGRRSFRLFADEVMPRVGVDKIPALAADEIRPEYRESAVVR